MQSHLLASVNEAQAAQLASDMRLYDDAGNELKMRWHDEENDI